MGFNEKNPTNFDQFIKIIFEQKNNISLHLQASDNVLILYQKIAIFQGIQGGPKKSL